MHLFNVLFAVKLTCISRTSLYLTTFFNKSVWIKIIRAIPHKAGVPLILLGEGVFEHLLERLWKEHDQARADEGKDGSKHVGNPG